MAESLLDFVRRQMLRPLPNQPVDGTVLRTEREAARPELARLASQDVEHLVRILKGRELDGQDSHGRLFEVMGILVETLASLDPAGERLRDVALEPGAAWYVRRGAVRALTARSDFPHMMALLPMLENTREVGEIREAILEGIVRGERTEVLPRLQALREKGPSLDGYWFGGAERVLVACARLGDPACVRPLISLIYSENGTHRESMLDAMQYLLDRDGGLTAVLDALEPRIAGMSDNDHLVYLVRTELHAPVRAWALHQLASRDAAGSAEALLESLGDPDWHVARTACAALNEIDDLVHERLDEIVRDTGLPAGHRLWAAYTRLREEPDAPVPLDSIPEPRVPLPGLPEAVRVAIVTNYASGSSPGTDVRWLIEAIGLEPLPGRDTPGLAEELGKACRAAGLSVGEITDYASVMQQGISNFMVVPVNDASIHLSDLGPFALLGSESQDRDLEPRLRRIAEARGWTWIVNEVASLKVTGLNVYFFGRREPLQVQDLLCYWQD